MKPQEAEMQGELILYDAAAVNRALALPGAQEVALPAYFDRLLKALDDCQELDQVRQIKDHAEEAAILARRLKDGRLMEKARKITAYTNQKLGDELKKIPNIRLVHPTPALGARPSHGRSRKLRTAREEAAEKAGLSKRTAANAVRIASIDRKIFETVVEQPGSVSTSGLLQIARAQKGEVSNSTHQRSSALRREFLRSMATFTDFTRRNEPAAIAKIVGDESTSLKASAMNARDWLTKLIRALE